MNRVLVPQISAPPVAPRNAQPVEFRGETMGTSWSVHGFAAPHFDGARFERDIEALFADIIAQMSPWAPGSLINRFNDLAAGESLELHPHFAAVLECALEIAAQTQGAFDPTLGALVDLWGFGAAPPAHAAPMHEAIASALNASGWRKLRRDGGRLVQPGGLRLDLNGIAKGYAVDQLADLAARAGLLSYLVEIGGELKGAGVKPDGQPWWVELESPHTDGAQPRTLVALHNLAVASSGDYRRFAIVEDARISHTISPIDGRPIATDVAAVSVLHTSCMHADAYATALQVLGPTAAIDLADALNLAVLLVTRTPEGYVETLSREAQALS
jgi:thiamine biosynthesis lipoprotein